MAIEQQNFKNILVIHFGQLGDVVLGLPAMRAVRENSPDARITALTGRIAGELVRVAKFADDVLAVDRVDLRDGPRSRSIAKIIHLVRDLRRQDLDLVIDLHSLKETNILAWLTGARHRLLANRGNRSYHSLNNFVPPPPVEDRSLHLSDTYMRVLSPLGLERGPEPVLIPSRTEDREYVRQKVFADLEGPFAGFFPGAGHPSRCWPLASFAEVATRLQAEGFMPAVFLGPEESGMRESVVEAFPTGTIVVEGLNIARFIAAAAEMSIFVTNDTGPMHLAGLAGVPILLVMDRRAPVTYLPLARSIEVVNSDEIDRISVDAAYEKASKLLQMTKPRTA